MPLPKRVVFKKDSLISFEMHRQAYKIWAHFYKMNLFKLDLYEKYQ